jgi:fatty acid desaturase
MYTTSDSARILSPTQSVPDDAARRPPAPFSLGELRLVIADLFVPLPRIYWTDLLISSATAWAAGVWAYRARAELLPYLLLSVVSALAFYRCWSFTHELAHLKGRLRRGAMPYYDTAWHLLCGLPLLSPGFMYHDVHLEHHHAHKYARDNDAEYLPFAVGSPWNILLYPFVVWPMPIFAVLRFTVLSLLSILHPALRRVIRERCSSAGMVPSHVREVPSGRELTRWNIQETAQSAFCFTVLGAVVLGSVSPFLLFHWWFVMAIFLTVNYTRALTAHRYTRTGGEISFHDQVLDSVNVTGGWLTELWAPAGTRYHGLHHMFPGIPYHSLATAHRRLVAHLPADHPYHRTIVSGLREGLVLLWRASCAAEREKRRAS